MALPNRDEWVVDGLRRVQVYGIVMRITPADHTLTVEIERAPDSAGAPDVGNKVSLGELGPLPLQGATYTDPRPNNGATWWYRMRHTSIAGDAGNFTAWGSATPRRLDDQTMFALTRATNVYPVRRMAPLTDGGFALKASESDGRTKVSSAIETQGSTVPMSVDASPFSYNTGGPAAGQMWVAWTWSAFNVYRPASGALAIAASSSMATPPTPTLSQVASGALGARTRYVKIGYVRDGKVYRVGAESSLAVLANNLLKVTAPSSLAGYTGWCVLVGSATGAERFQVSVLTSPLAFGADWTEPVGGADTTGHTPYNSAMDNAITDIANDPSTTYYWMPFWHLADGFVNLYSAFTSDTQVNALEAIKDGRIPLAYRVSGTTLKLSINALTPAGGSSSSGSGGGRF